MDRATLRLRKLLLARLAAKLRASDYPFVRQISAIDHRNGGAEWYLRHHFEVWGRSFNGRIEDEARLLTLLLDLEEAVDSLRWIGERLAETDDVRDITHLLGYNAVKVAAARQRHSGS